MKNLKKLFWLPLVVAMVFAGCESEVDDGSVSVYTEKTDKITTASGSTVINGKSFNVYTVPLGLENVNENGEFVVARTVLPNAWTTDSVEEYWLYGRSEFGTIIKESSNNYKIISKENMTAGITSGKGVAIDLAACKWELKLVGRTSSKDVLVGYQNVDFSNGGYKVTFALSASSLTGNGSAKITATLSDDTSGVAATAKANLYNPLTGKVVATSTTFDDSAHKATFDQSTVQAGSYNLEFIFYTATGTICAYATESVIVEANNKTEKELTYSGIIGQKPTAPANLKAKRIVNDYSPNATGTKYYVTFTWEDNSTNERNFVLRLTQADTEGGTPTGIDIGIVDADAAAGVNEKIALYNLNNKSSIARYIDGSLYAGSTSVTLELDTGYFYEATIAASNPIGESAFIERVDDTTTMSASDTTGAIGYKTTKTDSTATAFSDVTIAADKEKQTINLIRLMYDLNGGSYKKDDSTDASTNNIVEYKIFGADTFTLPEIKAYKATGTEYPYLVKGNVASTFIDFSHWAFAPESATKMTGGFNATSEFKGMANQTIYAVYQKPGVTVDIKTEIDIDPDRITASYSNPSAAMPIAAAEKCKIRKTNPGADNICNASEMGGLLVLTVGAPTGEAVVDSSPSVEDKKVFTSWYFKMVSSDGGMVSVGPGQTSSNTCTIKMDDVVQGSYTVLAGGYYEGRLYTLSFPIVVSR